MDNELPYLALWEDFPIEPHLKRLNVFRDEPRWGNRLRFEILRRDHYRCRYCGRGAEEVVLHVDHVTPRSRGGSNHHWNLVTACEQCNQGKKANEAPHPLTLARPQSRLSDDQAYVCELLRDARWRALMRWQREIDFLGCISDDPDTTWEDGCLLESMADGDH